MSEKQLLVSLKVGDHDAFTMLYNQYWRQVYNFCRLYVQNDEAEEVMQEVFIKLWMNRDSIDEDENLKGYLFIITRNLIFNRNRKKSYETALKMTLIAAVEESCEFEEEFNTNDLKEYIDTLIEKMPIQRQVIFNLSRKEYLSYKEIALKLGISEKTVEQSISRTIKFLKKKTTFLIATLIALIPLFR
ncbi:MAG: RNA polymerase sigma-70 factor [Bacteroides sp.]|uniref:RNA polymerase sigma-70 factor n=1 Tax=Bacteroides sp. TaxID=29523 RepID=UPI002FCBE742